jgi:hypothetical protein
VQAPLQQPSREQVVAWFAQGSGGGVVGRGAAVVVVVGDWRRGGRDRLPVVRAVESAGMAPPAAPAAPRPSRPLSTDLREAPLAMRRTTWSNDFSSTAVLLFSTISQLVSRRIIF